MIRKIFDIFKSFQTPHQHTPDSSPLLPQPQEPVISPPPAQDIRENLLKYQESLGDLTTQTVFDDNIPIIKQPLNGIQASFAYDPVIPEKNRAILISDKSQVSRTDFFHFMHECRHYTQNKSMPNFHLISRVIPEHTPFIRHICELDAYLYEGKKAALDYINTGDLEQLHDIYYTNGTGLMLYASALGIANIGKPGDLSFGSTKFLLDRMPKTLMPDKHMQAANAYFCYSFSFQKEQFAEWDNTLITTLPATYNYLNILSQDDLSLVKNDLFAHTANREQAQKLLYRDKPNKHFLDYINSSAQAEFWKNMQSMSPEYRAMLPDFQDATKQAHISLKRIFG